MGDSFSNWRFPFPGALTYFLNRSKPGCFCRTILTMIMVHVYSYKQYSEGFLGQDLSALERRFVNAWISTRSFPTYFASCKLNSRQSTRPLNP
jgi:hypothetical protein